MRATDLRGGWLLVEALVAITLGAVVLAGVAGLVRGALGGGRVAAGRAEALEVVRTIWVVLDEELGAGVADRDWALDSDGAIALRAFRGFGRICGSDPDRLSVAYRGRRLPDPDRDSLLVLTTDGAWTASSFVGATPRGSCALEQGEREVGLAAVAPSGTPVLVRVFERGSYHLADGAFRYRRGGGGRQPLTPERLAVGSRFEVTADGIVARVELDPGAGIGPFTWRIPNR